MMKPWDAIDNLKTNQAQLDVNGCMIAVSRQALTEVLDYLDWLEGQMPLPHPTLSEVLNG